MCILLNQLCFYNQLSCLGLPDSEQTSLRAGCLRRLRKIHTQLKTQSGAQAPSNHTNVQTQVQGEWSQVLLEDCAMLLLTRLIELQEVQALCLIQELLDRVSQDTLLCSV